MMMMKTNCTARWDSVENGSALGVQPYTIPPPSRKAIHATTNNNNTKAHVG